VWNVDVLVSSFSLVSKADIISLAMKGRLWLTKASRVRSSVWRVGRKPPGKSSLVAVLPEYYLCFPL